MLWIVSMVVALVLGVYIGLGFPGLPGSEDRVIPGGSPRRRREPRRKHMVLDWLRPRKR